MTVRHADVMVEPCRCSCYPLGDEVSVWRPPRIREGLGVQSRGEVDWVEGEALRVVGPGSAYCLVWCEAAEGLEPLGEVIGVQEGCEMRLELVVRLVAIAFDG